MHSNNSPGGKAAYPQLLASNSDRFKRIREKYDAHPNKCKQCDHNLLFEKRQDTFCCHECAYIHRRRATATKNGTELNCIFCGKELERHSKKYCSLKCQADYIWSERKEKISSSGVVTGGDNLSRSARHFLIEVRGYECEICGIKEWMGQQVPLVLDHINGHAEDWHVYNLRLICCNCDAQTPTYKGKNKGNGRHCRKQRYHEGRSY